MKIKIIFVLTAILTLAFQMPNAAFSPAETNAKQFDYAAAYTWAEEAGFSAVFLEDISEEALKRVYFDNITAEEITVTNAVGAMTGGDLAEKDINCASDSVVQKSGGTVIGTTIYFTVHWKNGMPMNRLTDGIVSTWNSNWIFKDNSFWGLVEDVHNTGGPTKVLLTSNRASTQEQGGLGWFAKLSYSPLGYTPTVRIGYTLTPKNLNMPASETDETSVTSTYGHTVMATQVISFTGSYPALTMRGQEGEVSVTTTFKHG